MNKIEELLSILCPEGIVFKRMGDLGTFYGGLSGKSKNDFIDGNAIFITYMNVYSNKELKIDVSDRVRIHENEKQNTIQYGDILFTGSSETPDECGMASVLTKHTDEKLYLNSFCFGFRFRDPRLFLPQFTKYLFHSSNLRYQIIKTASGVTRFNVSKKKMEEVTIPVPPLPVQQEIVRVLDTFTRLSNELEKKLKSELLVRKKQCECYQNNLLTFPESVPYVKLETVAEIGTGSSNTNEGLEEGLYPFFVRSQIPLRKNEYEFDETAIITAGDGVGVGKVYHFIEGKYALHQRAYRIHITAPEILPKFFFHYMKATFFSYISKAKFQGSVSSIRRPMLNSYPVPIPPIDVQKSIIQRFDIFESTYHELYNRLDEEITMRQKQYEYYRDKLLTFKEKSHE